MSNHRYHLDVDGHSITLTVTGRHPCTAALLIDGKEEDIRRLSGKQPVELHGELADDAPRLITIQITPDPGRHAFQEASCALLMQDGTRRPLPSAG
ncbi:hypothetical protein ACFQZC_36405 [Streptacidiphilus monticola]